MFVCCIVHRELLGALAKRQRETVCGSCAVGCWLFFVCCWLMVGPCYSGGLLLIIGCWLLVVSGWWLNVGCLVLSSC